MIDVKILKKPKGGSTTVGSGINAGGDSGQWRLQSLLDSKLDKSVFDDMFELVTENGVTSIKAKYGLWTEEFLSSRGLNSNGGGAIGGGASSLAMLDDVNLSTLATGQALVYDGTHWVNQSIQQGLDENALATYLTSNQYAKVGDIPSLAGYATEQWVANKGYALESALTTHTGNNTIHISATERALWNQTASNLSSILGSDASGVIDKWDEIVAFLDTYTEADTLAGLLSNKANSVHLHSISEITGLQSALNGKLDASVFNGMFELVTENGVTSIKAKYGLWTEQFLSARGLGSGGSGGISQDELDAMLVDYAKQSWVQSQGYLTSSALTGYATQSWVEGKGYLTGHQSLANYVDRTSAQTIGGQKIFTSQLYVDLSGTNNTTPGSLQTILYVRSKNTGLTYGSPIISVIGNREAANAWNHDIRFGSQSGATWISAGESGETLSSKIQFDNTENIYLSSDGDIQFYTGCSNDSASYTKSAWIDTNGVNAIKFIKSGGTSSQFLKADGSVDSNTYALNSSLSSYAKLQSPNNLIHAGNEFTFASPAFNGDIYINYRTASNACDGNITSYIFRNGKDGYSNLRASGFIKNGGTSSQFLKADGSVDGTAYLPLSGGTLTGNLLINGNSSDTPLDIKSADANGCYIRMSGSSSSFGYYGARSTGPVWYNGTNNTIWHSGNDGAGSGLDADLLDGVHESGFARFILNPNSASPDLFRFMGYAYATNDTLWRATGPTIGFGANAPYHKLIQGSFYENNLFLNTCNNGTYLGWREFAFTDSNVASASRLQGTSSYSAWGQTFWQNGVPNSISGSLSSVAHITMSGYLYSTVSGTARTVLNYHSDGSLALNYGLGVGANLPCIIYGNTGLGIKPTERLHVDGNINTTGANGRFIKCNGASHEWGLHQGTGGENRGIYEWTAGYDRWLLYFTNSNTILNHGNVGIGISPSYKLDVNGTGRFVNHLSVGAGLSQQTVGRAELSLISETDVPNDLMLGRSGTKKWSITSRSSSESDYFGIYNYTTGAMRLVILENGNIGIGTTASSYKLHVAGVIYGSTGIFSDGYVSSRGQNTSSDIRLKKKLNAFEIALHQIAHAPSVGFEWLEGSNDVGSIAQYWQSVNPLLTPKDPKGYLTLQYGKTALLSVISVAKRVESHEERIAKLEKENRELKNIIVQLERR